MKIKINITLFTIICCSIQVQSFAQKNKDTHVIHPIADSMKATGFIQTINIKSIKTKKEFISGIMVDDVRLYVESEKKEREIVMQFPPNATLVTKGLDVEEDEPGELEFDYNWQLNEPYKLYIATATDSAQNFILYSGYIFLPNDNKWKLIGTCKKTGNWGFIKAAHTISTIFKKQVIEQDLIEIWYQKNNGTFKSLLTTTEVAPVLAPFSNLDSSTQFKLDSTNIYNNFQKDTQTKIDNVEGVFYTILKQGEGNKVNVTDTVTVHYKGYIFETGYIFDQTKEKPATFPLNRLIKGWQLAVPKINVGGSVKIIIPSGLAYSIRTRSPKIPPNSNLVFEISVEAAKPK